jgi:sulfur carrier protein
MSDFVIVNGEKRDWHGQSMTELLREFNVAPDKGGVAVALNADVVPRSEWDAVALKPGDKIEIVHIVRGG